MVQWSKVSGGPATIQSPTAPVTQLTGLAEGQYVFRLTATDDQGNTASSEATVTVQAADPQLLRKTWMIDGQQRQAVIHAPEGAAGAGATGAGAMGAGLTLGFKEGAVPGETVLVAGALLTIPGAAPGAVPGAAPGAPTGCPGAAPNEPGWAPNPVVPAGAPGAGGGGAAPAGAAGTPGAGAPGAAPEPAVPAGGAPNGPGAPAGGRILPVVGSIKPEPAPGTGPGGGGTRTGSRERPNIM